MFVACCSSCPILEKMNKKSIRKSIFWRTRVRSTDYWSWVHIASCRAERQMKSRINQNGISEEKESMKMKREDRIDTVCDEIQRVIRTRSAIFLQLPQIIYAYLRVENRHTVSCSSDLFLFSFHFNWCSDVFNSKMWFNSSIGTVNVFVGYSWSILSRHSFVATHVCQCREFE